MVLSYRVLPLATWRLIVLGGRPFLPQLRFEKRLSHESMWSSPTTKNGDLSGQGRDLQSFIQMVLPTKGLISNATTEIALEQGGWGVRISMGRVNSILGHHDHRGLLFQFLSRVDPGSRMLTKFAITK